MSSLLRRENLSAVDTAWLRMEDPTNLMMISGVFLFDEPIDVDRLRKVIEYRLITFDRFRQRVVDPRFGLPYWEHDPHFSLDNHMHRVALPSPGDQAALQEMVSDLMSTPLDFNRPLWHVHIIEGFGAGSAVLMRLHHSIADGIALMYVLLSLSDLTDDAPLNPPEKDEKRKPNPIVSLLRRASGILDNTRETGEKVLREGMEKLSQPDQAWDFLKQGRSTALSGSKSLARLALRPADPQTIFRGPLQVAKKAAWSDPISLADVKRIGKVTGGTVNDVLLTAMTGALRRYLLYRGDVAENLVFHAAVPVNLRPMNEMGELGNKFGIFFLPLPVGIADPVARLKALKNNMDELKNSPEALITFGILGAMGYSLSEVQNLVVSYLATKVTAVMTNVPGPRFPIYLAGSSVTGIMFWVPQSGRVGLGISIFSYAGTVRLGLAVDAGLVREPDQIIEAFHVEFDEMVKLADWAEAEEAAAEAAAGEEETTAVGGDDDEEEIPVAAEAAAVDEQPETCQGMTKTGRPCRNRPAPGSRYCWRHG